MLQILIMSISADSALLGFPHFPSQAWKPLIWDQVWQTRINTSEVFTRCSREAVEMSVRAGEVAEVRLFPVSHCCLSHTPLFYFLSCQMIVDKFWLLQTKFLPAGLWGMYKECVCVCVCHVLCSLPSWAYDD